MSNALTCTALVLRKKELPQRDTVVVLFTYEFGKMVSFARNLRGKTNRRAAHLQTGNLVTVHITQRRESSYLDQTTLITAFSSIKSDYERIKYVYTYLAVLDGLLAENQQEASVFEETLTFLKTISRTENMKRSLLLNSITNVLEALGYAVPQGVDLFTYIEELSGAKIPVHDIM